MGNRANVKLMYGNGSNIYLYTHWGGSTIHETLARALGRGADRIGDESYLARIIFSEMIQGDILGTTGYGIAPYPIDSGPMPSVNLSTGEITTDYGGEP